MKKYLFLIFLFLPALLFSLDEKMEIILVEAPLSPEIDAGDIRSHQSYYLMEQPFVKGDCSFRRAGYISGNGGDYDAGSGAFVVIQEITKADRMEYPEGLFISLEFRYTLFRGPELLSETVFTAAGTGKDEDEALEMCFGNGALSVVRIMDGISRDQSLWQVAGIYSGEYVLDCGRKDKVRKGDEFRLFSAADGEKKGKLFAVKVRDDITFVQAAWLDKKVMVGDRAERIRLAGFGTNLYYDYIFGDGVSCFGAYQEYFRGFLSFRPVTGIEYNDFGDGLFCLYGGLKTMRRFGKTEISALVTIGRGSTGGEFCYTGGSMKLTAGFPAGDHILISGECGYATWLPDHDDEYDEFGGMLLGGGITFRY